MVRAKPGSSTKGQLISKGRFGNYRRFDQKTNEIVLRIFVQASKKSSNHKIMLSMM